MLAEAFARYRDYLCADNLRWSKIHNTMRYLASRRAGERLWHRPLYYMIESGNVCRLRCSFCCQGHYDPSVNSAKTVLPYADFLKILAKIRKFALVIDLFKHGEPFLNPDLVPMIEAARRAGVRCRVHSTLNCALGDATAAAVARSGLYKLVCAIDGTTQEVYQRYRQNGSLALALDNARRILRARRGRYPRMLFRMLVFEWNHGQVEAARRLAAEAGFDRFQAEPGVHLLDGAPHRWDLAARRWEPVEWHLESVLPRHAPHALPPKSRRPCPTLFNTMVLHASGASMVCCHASRKDWEHESLLDRDLDEVWNSERYLATRRYALGLDHDREAVWAQCRGCCWL